MIEGVYLYKWHTRRRPFLSDCVENEYKTVQNNKKQLLLRDFQLKNGQVSNRKHLQRSLYVLILTLCNLKVLVILKTNTERSNAANRWHDDPPPRPMNAFKI
jgi:hypothetical protein